jgi:hypothetical protein
MRPIELLEVLSMYILTDEKEGEDYEEHIEAGNDRTDHRYYVAGQAMILVRAVKKNKEIPKLILPKDKKIELLS